jgi:phosphoserine phosphatase
MSIRYVCFDLDGTLLDDGDGSVSVWSQIHRKAGTPDQENIRRFEMFMRGEISYVQWVDIDIGEWQRAGLTREGILLAVKEMRLMPGARETVAELENRGYRLAVISGSLNVGLDALFPDHPFDPVFVNRVFFDGDGLISRWEATTFDMREKSEGLRMLAREREVSLEECAFVGDNFNDVDVASAAGFSVAFNSKSEGLDAVADVVIREKDLSLLLAHFPPLR